MTRTMAVRYGGLSQCDFDPLCPAQQIEISPTEFEHQVRDWLARAAERIEKVSVTHQGSISGQGGEYAIDVVVRLTLFGHAEIVVLAECKHHKRPATRDHVSALDSKLRDTGAHKGMLFSTSGFQEGALKLATARGIATITVMEGTWLYETKSFFETPSVPPPWVTLPRIAGQKLTAEDTGYSCHTINDAQVDAIREFLTE